MSILKSSDYSPFAEGEAAYLMHLNGPMSMALECKVVNSNGNTVTCDGICQIPEGCPITLADKKLQSVMNSVGQSFTISRDRIHRNLDMFPKY